MTFQSINYDPPLPKQLDRFTLCAKSNTDLWTKPSATNKFNCPFLYRIIKLASFSRARVSVSAAWKDQYDQGGLCLMLPQKDGPPKWIKTGIEFEDGSAHVSTVATDRWSDWSLYPVPSNQNTSDVDGGNGGDGNNANVVVATVEMSKHRDGSLWVYLIDGDRKEPLREVTWFADLGGSDECWIGAYTAKPSKSGELAVSFSHLVIEAS